MITNLKHLTLALRLCEIPRWGIVAMARQQSTAEHSYRVAMIAVAMYHHMEQGTPHNSLEERDLVSLSLYHDMFEVLSGDLDSIFKGMLEDMHPGVLDNTVEAIAQKRGLGGLHGQLASLERSAQGSIVSCLKKLADLVEACLYLKTYGANNYERERVVMNLRLRILTKLRECGEQTMLAGYDWAKCKDFIFGLLDGQPIDITTETAEAAQEPGLSRTIPPRCPGRDLRDGAFCGLVNGHPGACFAP